MANSPATSIAIPEGHENISLNQHDMKDSPPAPINRLDRSLFLYISTFNAVEDEGKFNPRKTHCAVDTLRYTSQVCASWRSSILSSPHLWGQAVNFNRLVNAGWRAEVLRRTGDAPLCLYGDLVDDQDGAVSTIVIDNWRRIRRLELRLVGYMYLDNVKNNEKLWAALGDPAPSIEVFALGFLNSVSRDNVHEVDVGQRHQPILSLATFRLFGGHAPCLTRYDAPNIRFDASCRAVTGRLQYLRLDQPSNVNQLVEVIISTPTLLTLSISFLASNDPIPLASTGKKDGNKAYKSNLQRIEILEPSDHNAYIALLSAIELVDDHDLIIHCCEALETHDSLREAQVTQIGDILHRYASQARKAIAASLQASLWLDVDTFQVHFKSPGSEYDIQISDPAAAAARRDDADPFSFALLRRFPIPAANLIEDATLALKDDKAFYTAAFDALAPAFLAVTKLSAPPSFFVFMADTPAEPRFGSAFPKLESLFVIYHSVGDGGASDIRRYIDRRREMGMSSPMFFAIAANLLYL